MTQHDIAGSLESEIAALRAEIEEKESRLRMARRHATPAGLRRSAGSASASSPLMVAVTSAGYTLRSLAEHIGVPHVYLSQAHTGARRIRRAIADRVEELTGYAATKSHWPAGIIEGPRE